MTVFTVCPFCGIPSEQPHDSEAACISALQAEVEKTRDLLAAVDAARADPFHQSRARPDVQTT